MSRKKGEKEENKLSHSLSLCISATLYTSILVAKLVYIECFQLDEITSFLLLICQARLFAIGRGCMYVLGLPIV